LTIYIDALMNSVHNTSHYADMTDDTALISSEILSLRYCKSAERVSNTLLFRQLHINKSQADSSGELAKKCRECTMDSRSQIQTHVFIKWRL
jgi:hypothetical protein